MGTVNRLVEVTFLLILTYLVLANFTGFSSAMSSFGSFYTSSIKALQGR